MNKKTKQSTQTSGFTIIEVVLVLAIAGLIFLMVFIALPALQRGQRDTQRKQDLSRISVQMTNYISSSRGAIPSADNINNFVENYLRRDNETAEPGRTGSDYVDPTDGPYRVLANPSQDLGKAEVGYWPRRLCDADSGTGVTSNTSAARDYAFTIKLESQNVPFCIDNKS